MAIHKHIRFDWTLKGLLWQKANFTILEGFLSELFMFDVKILKILENESNRKHKHNKLNKVDIHIFTLQMKLTISLIFLLFPLFVSAQKKIPPEKPKLIVGIVVEQMRYDYLVRFWNKYEEGGFRRLIDQGTLCKNAYLNYMITHSASGYATIATGTTPSNHGIIADEWYVRLKKMMLYCTRDDERNTVGGGTLDGKMSPQHLVTSTISDELKMASNYQSKIISVSMKDYAAVLSGGHISNAAYWIENQTGNWITSSYYMEALPKWVNEFNDKKISDIYLAREWSPLLLLSDYKESLSDKNSYEIGIRSQNTFPYNLPTLKTAYGNYSILKYTPFGNTYTKDFAISAIAGENLGKGDATDYISIGFAANGYLSDLYGPRALEMEDTYLRLDKDLSHFLSFLDDYIGKENVLVYLTADRGANDIPQFLIDTKMPAGYFYPKNALAILKSYLKAIYGDGDWLKSYNEQQLYLNQALIEDSKISLAAFQTQVSQLLIQFGGVANAVTANTLQTSNFTDGILKKVQNSYNQNRSADVIINLAPGWMEKNEDKKAPSVITHNSGYEYDTHVPLIWYGWKMKRTSVWREVSLCDIAPTLANFLNIPLPNFSTGKPILELLE